MLLSPFFLLPVRLKYPSSPTLNFLLLAVISTNHQASRICHVLALLSLDSSGPIYLVDLISVIWYSIMGVLSDLPHISAFTQTDSLDFFYLPAAHLQRIHQLHFSLILQSNHHNLFSIKQPSLLHFQVFNCTLEIAISKAEFVHKL